MNTHQTAALHTAQRSQAYGFFAALFEYPEGELAELVRSGQVARQARQLIGGLYPDLAGRIDASPLAVAGDEDALAIEYTRLFDVVEGSAGPRCPLNSTDYTGDQRMRQLEELVRFYNHFGLSSAETAAHERPDHLTTQLDFLQYLCFQETHCEDDTDAGNYRRAQRDFLQRHPARWAPLLQARLAKNDAQPFYRGLGDLFAAFIAADTRQADAAAGPAPHGPEGP